MGTQGSSELDFINQTILKESPHTYELFSPKGRLYFSKKLGILNQAAEAKQKATKFNATIGIATDGSLPLSIPAINKFFPQISPQKAYPYTPSSGVPELREIWKKRMQRLSPSVPQNAFSTHITTPITTAGISYGLSIAANLFLGQDDSLILTDPYWENYYSIFSSRDVRSFVTFDTFSKDGLFNVDALDQCLKKHFSTNNTHIAKIVLNFPNNPSGYSITTKKAMELTQLLVSYANSGKNFLIICDDAYFGLFYEPDVFPESIFSLLSHAHQRITAVKLDGVTKEFFAWGLRVGFITFGSKGLSPSSINMIENKCAGVVRSDISTCSTLVQNILVQAFSDPALEEQAAANVAILKKRAIQVKKVLANPSFFDEFEAAPFNSGYFMILILKRCNAEQLRVHLLDKYQIGLISINDSQIRIAFSCVPQESIEELFSTVYKACKDL